MGHPAGVKLSPVWPRGPSAWRTVLGLRPSSQSSFSSFLIFPPLLSLFSLLFLHFPLTDLSSLPLTHMQMKPLELVALKVQAKWNILSFGSYHSQLPLPSLFLLLVFPSLNLALGTHLGPQPTSSCSRTLH